MFAIQFYLWFSRNKIQGNWFWNKFAMKTETLYTEHDSSFVVYRLSNNLWKYYDLILYKNHSPYIYANVIMRLISTNASFIISTESGRGVNCNGR